MSTTATKADAPRTITMLDGRTVEFPGKRRLQKTSIRTEYGRLQVRLDFENGESRLLTLRPDMLATYALHGAEQKLGDEISGVDDIEDAVEAIDQLMARLDAGDWTKERSGGGGMAGASILARALVEVTKQPIAVVRDYLSKLDNKTKTALRVSPEVAPTIKRLEDEKAKRAAERGGKTANKVDVAGALAGLLAAGQPGPNSAFAAGQVAAAETGDTASAPEPAKGKDKGKKAEDAPM